MPADWLGSRSEHYGCEAVRVVGYQEGELERDIRRRRRLAERVARELAERPRGDDGSGNAFLSSTVVEVRLSSYTEAFEAHTALHEAPRVVFWGAPTDMGQLPGPDGTIMFIHGPEFWSVIFPLDPFTGLILVCADDLPKNCFQIRVESPEDRKAISDFHTGIVLSLANRRNAITKGLREPDPTPLLIPD